MPLSDAGRIERLSDIAADWNIMSLHTGDPGTTGANECFGGSPAYAKQSITWTAPTGPSMSLAASPTFSVKQNDTVTHVGFWKGSQFQAGFPLTTQQPFTNQGTLTIDNYTLTQPAS